MSEDKTTGVEAKPDRPSGRDYRSNQGDSSSSNRGGSHYLYLAPVPIHRLSIGKQPHGSSFMLRATKGMRSVGA